jgi:hypothetical protein
MTGLRLARPDSAVATLPGPLGEGALGPRSFEESAVKPCVVAPGVSM